MKLVTIVIPLYNESDTLPELWSRLSVLHVDGIRFNYCFVNDGSQDTTQQLLEELAGRQDHVSWISLSRNFGHSSALSAGIDRARGDALVLMDGDLQDKPEVIPQFIESWNEGADVVYAIRSSRKENIFCRFLFKSFYKLLAQVSGIQQPLDAGIFGLLDRRVADVIRSMPERNRYLPGLRAYAGFRQKGVCVDRDARFAGKPRVTFRGLVRLALDAVFAFSYVPIRIVTAFGLFTAMGSFVYILVIVYKKYVSGEAILGWPSTLGALLFLGGLKLVMLGVLGEYIARIYEEVKQRPYYIVAKENMETA